MNKPSVDRSIIFVKKDIENKKIVETKLENIAPKKIEIPDFDFSGKIVHIVASGPSAKGLDVGFFESLRRDNTIFIAVNHAYKECNPDFIFFIDKAFATIEDNSNVLQHKAIKFSIDQKIEGCFCVNNTIEHTHTSDKKKFYRGKLSGAAALSFAVKRNPEKIFLWGFDCGKIEGEKNLHSTTGKHAHRFETKKDEKIFREGIKSFACIPTKNVYNVSPNSNLLFFDRISLDEFYRIY